MTEILLISGSVRRGSVNGAVLATAGELSPVGVQLFDDLESLPHFNPDLDRDPLPERVVELRAAIEAASAILISSPEYAGAMPGVLKTLLEWTVGGTEISDKPVGWINPSTMPNRAAATYSSIASVLRYTGATIVESACADIPVTRSQIGSDGIIADPSVRARIRAALEQLIEAAAATD